MLFNLQQLVYFSLHVHPTGIFFLQQLILISGLIARLSQDLEHKGKIKGSQRPHSNSKVIFQAQQFLKPQIGDQQLPQLLLRVEQLEMNAFPPKTNY